MWNICVKKKKEKLPGYVFHPRVDGEESGLQNVSEKEGFELANFQLLNPPKQVACGNDETKQ